MLKGAIRNGEADFPAGVWRVCKNDLVLGGGGSLATDEVFVLDRFGVHFHVLFKLADLETSVIQVNLDSGTSACQVVDSSLH